MSQDDGLGQSPRSGCVRSWAQASPGAYVLGLSPTSGHEACPSNEGLDLLPILHPNVLLPLLSAAFLQTLGLPGRKPEAQGLPYLYFKY